MLKVTLLIAVLFFRLASSQQTSESEKKYNGFPNFVCNCNCGALVPNGKKEKQPSDEILNMSKKMEPNKQKV